MTGLDINNRVSTASFSIAAFWLGVRVVVARVREAGGGVAGMNDCPDVSEDVLRLLRLLVYRVGGCTW